MATFNFSDESSQPDPMPGVLDEIRRGIEQAYQAVASDQRDAHDFFVASGSAVVGGHPQVRRPGAQGDPDPTLDESDY